MKESVTKFDFEAAFKALDEIEVPVTNEGVKANRPALTEIFSRKSKFESLFEEYYDIGSSEELGQAKEDREAEVAKAKLERIEKIVDLDADSPEDLLTSYVGKYIIQCPQCMTLFYKNQEDVVESEDDPNTVNVSEVCQHCGNESGYTLVGKVGEATAEETDSAANEIPTADEELPTEELPDDGAEETTEGEEDLGDFDLDDINIDEEPAEEEEKKEESFVAHTGEALVEDVQDDKELDAKLEAHNEYIEYLRAEIAKEEKELENTKNEQVKAAIQRRIDAYKEDLEKALPDEVKNSTVVEESAEEASVEEPVEAEEADATLGEALTEALKEEKEVTDLEVSADEFEKLINEPEFKKPISDSAVRAMIATDKEEETDVKESIESEVLTENNFTNWLGRAFKNRSSMAEWVLTNAKKDYTSIKTDDKGKVIADPANQKFKAFTVAYFTNKFNDNNEITNVPTTADFNKLVKAKDSEAKVSYTDAENIAKGWSKIADNGPALIFLSNGASDSAAEFLCMYFNGDLDKKSDQLAKQLENVKNGLAGAKSLAKGKSGQADTKQVKASELENGMQIITKNKGIAEITEKTEGDFADFKITYKLQDNSTVSIEVAASQVFNTPVLTATESLNTVMAGIEELQEATLESMIADSLVEAYGNVAGYKLTSCEYLYENLKVNGTVYFTSGKARKLTYTFSESFVSEEGKVSLQGLNEKLGADKQFILAGRVNNKTFITESFKQLKK